MRCPHPSLNIWPDNLNWNVQCPPLLRKYLRILCGVPTLVKTSGQMIQIGMCGVPPSLLLLKHLRILCGVPTLVWTSDQIASIEMCDVPSPMLQKYLRILCSVPTQVWTSDQMLQIGMCGVPNSQISYHFSCKSNATFISKCDTPSWACLAFLSTA